MAILRGFPPSNTISPSIRITEKDLSFVPSEQQFNNSVLIGFATKGPINTPTLIVTTLQLHQIFGYPDPTISAPYLIYAAEQVLTTGNQIYIVRVADIDPSSQTYANTANVNIPSAGTACVIIGNVNQPFDFEDMDGDADVVRSGERRDFAFGTDGIETYPLAPVDRVLHDGDTVVLGGVTLTAHHTGGHTRGCTAWTFRTHISGDPAGRFRDVVIVGGWRPLSQYRFFDTPGQPASYPGIKNDFYKTFATLRALPCDIFLGAHGIYFDLLPKVNRMQNEGEAAFIDPKGYVEAVNDAQAYFDETVAAQIPKK